MRKSLKILECRNFSQIVKKDGVMIGNEGTSQLQLKEIYFGGNVNITKFNHMKNSLRHIKCHESFYRKYKYSLVGIKVAIV